MNKNKSRTIVYANASLHLRKSNRIGKNQSCLCKVFL